MYSQLRLCGAQLKSELAIGLLPSQQHCLLASAIVAPAKNTVASAQCMVPSAPGTAAPAKKAVVTRLIFPVADRDLDTLLRSLLAQYFGHKLVLTGFAVQPELSYVMLPTPVGVPAAKRTVVKSAEPALMVSALALAPSEARYEPRLPYLTFDTPYEAAITFHQVAPFHPVALFYGSHYIPRQCYAQALGLRPLSYGLPGHNTYGGQCAAKSALAKSLKSLRGLDLTTPTALASNHALQLCLNPEVITPVYGAFLAQNQLCPLTELTAVLTQGASHEPFAQHSPLASLRASLAYQHHHALLAWLARDRRIAKALAAAPQTLTAYGTHLCA